MLLLDLHVLHMDRPVLKKAKGLTRQRATLCPVCLDDFVLHEAICELPCSHLFHERCIFPWLKATGGPCPLCRAWVRPNLDKLMRTNVA